VVGKTLGHYEILEPLGAGGMGEVYRARDVTLKREVAIKVLAAEFADDAGRLARLEREAHLLASLNHPNIATIHSLDHEGDTRFLVLELVKGQSLEQQLAAGPLTIEKAVDFGKQIAEALEAAHGEGIIHRDLKPANVVITPDGRAKVLDFGIAKSVDAGATNVGTKATDLTVAGTLVGTVPFMSPEQIRGEAIDKRVDAWAFGCVLFEMLTGSSPFGRETVADTLAAIIEQEPDWSRLPVGAPDSVRSLLHRCLQKDAKLRLRDLGDAWLEMNALATDSSGLLAGGRRLHDIADARIEIEEILEHPAGQPAGETSAALPRLVIGGVVGAVLGAAAVWLGLGAIAGSSQGNQTATGSIRAQYVLPDGETIAAPPFQNTLAISPNGDIMVYAAYEGDSRRHLRWRRMNADDSEAVPNSESAHTPFFHPDGERLGFIVGGEEIFTWEIDSPVAAPIGSVPGARGAAWGSAGTIVVGTDARGLQTIPEDGGAPTPLTTLDRERGELNHRNPSYLPDGRVLFEISDTGDLSSSKIAVTSATGEVERILGATGADPRYVASGHLLLGRFPDIWAVAFDPDTATVLGSAVPVLAGVEQEAGRQNPKLAVSGSGTAIYQVRGVRPPTEIVRVDLAGRITLAGNPPGSFFGVHVSPAGERIAAINRTSGLGAPWIFDLETRQADDLRVPGQTFPVVWASDEAVYYSSIRGETPGVGSHVYKNSLATRSEEVVVEANGPGEELGPSLQLVVMDAIPEWLLFSSRIDRERGDRSNYIWLVPTSDTAASRPLIDGDRYPSGWARFSPNGNWVAYKSGSSVYVTTIPGGESQVLVAGEGDCPLVSAEGDRVYFLSGNDVMFVSVAPDTGANPRAPELLFALGEDIDRCDWDVFPDGTGFVMVREVDSSPPANQLRIIINWFEELKERVPTGRR